MVNKIFVLYIITGLILIIFESIYLTKVDDIEFFSLFSEGFITITIFVISVNLYSLRINKNKNKNIYYYLNVGFLFLFIAFLVDSLDEVLEHPQWLTTIFEDIFQIFGFLVLLLGIVKWINLNNEQNEELKNLATTDALTGLFNRRYFHEELLKEFNRYQRTKSSFAILMIDIDQFKSINDNHSHSTGDVILQTLSNVSNYCLRKTDTIARWGGDEFIVLLLDIDSTICSETAERIRKKIEDIVVAVDDSVVNLTVSIGAAIAKNDDESIEVVIDRADKLLYQAKENGKNCVALDLDPLAMDAGKSRDQSDSLIP